MVTTYERQTTPSPATDDTLEATHLNSEFDYLVAQLNDFDASNCKKSGTSIPLANITGLTSTQMAAAFFLTEEDMASNSATAVSSQRAIKAHQDAVVGSSYRLVDVNGTPTKVYTKYLTGTLDADTETIIAHGVTSGLTKILSLSGAFGTGTNFEVQDYSQGAFSGPQWFLLFDGANVIVTGVGANVQGQAYRIKIDYEL